MRYKDKSTKKDQSIETIRGIALLLMVAAHVIGANSQEGMRIDDQSFGRYIYFSFMHIRMPLFTVISGYVYSMRPVSTQLSYLKFFRSKARRLLLPLISISTIQYIVQCYMPGVNSSHQINDIWKIYFFSYSHFWFIQSIFLIIITISIIDYLEFMSTIRNWLLVLIIASAFFLFANFGSFFSLNRALYLFPFFILGCGIKRFEYTLFNNRVLLLSLLTLLLTGITLQQLHYFNIINIPIDRRSLIGLLIGISATVLLVKVRFKNRLLARIGYYSYGIFLLHLFGTASSRIFLETLNISQNKTFVFIISFVIGVIVPILMEIIIIKSNWLRIVLLGHK